MSVIPFPRRTYLRLDHGCTYRPGTKQPGDRLFWLEYVEADGGACVLWSGERYADALKEAARCFEPGMVFQDRYAGWNGGAA